ncbi:protein-ribulosamine 3-kinase [Aureococcus anophagefferens]|nr:protein-ribulosamine 3-kinase [Aureococcus anophagefferens]
MRTVALVLVASVASGLRAAPRIAARARVTMGGAGDVKRWFVDAGLGEAKPSGGSLGGSGWSQTGKWVTDDASYFVKQSSRSRVHVRRRGRWPGERATPPATRAACASRRSSSRRTTRTARAFIVMEFLNMGSRATCTPPAMAQMHLSSPAVPEAAAGQFGFPVDNTIGATPQPNGWTDDWVAFYRDKRLAHQFFDADEAIEPVILHGDLWSGNIGTAGAPSIFDPACYFGHHEAEWGMSWCASLGPQFWQGYRELIPEAPKFAQRRPLYGAPPAQPPPVRRRLRGAACRARQRLRSLD